MMRGPYVAWTRTIVLGSQPMGEYERNVGEVGEASIITRCLKTTKFVDQIDLLPLEHPNHVLGLPGACKTLSQS